MRDNLIYGIENLLLISCNRDLLIIFAIGILTVLFERLNVGISVCDLLVHSVFLLLGSDLRGVMMGIIRGSVDLSVGLYMGNWCL